MTLMVTEHSVVNVLSDLPFDIVPADHLIDNYGKVKTETVPAFVHEEIDSEL